MNKYQWVIKENIAKDVAPKLPKLHPVISQLLFDRGLVTPEQIQQFLQPDYGNDVYDPYLFSQMQRAVDRIFSAQAAREKVIIYGDYDADGVCGSAILTKVFEEMDLDFETYLPNRELEGYGLNAKAINELADKKAKLIITVDCGISNNNEVELVKKLGMDVIITDHHHSPGSLPKAWAIIHPGLDPGYPFKDLSGGGTAFKLAQALLRQLKKKSGSAEDPAAEKWLLDLVAISTVADLVPLMGENRALVKYGLLVLGKTKNLGLQKLMEIAGLNLQKVDTRAVGWQIAPRINAAGRMDHANSAYRLLTTANVEEAITIASGLNKRNADRQSLTEKLIEESKKQIGPVPGDLPVIFSWGADWPVGVIGLVASKLTNLHGRPAIVLSKQGEKLVASGRSIQEFNLIEALTKFKDYFDKFGGHSGAAGFSIGAGKFDEFKAKFTALAQEQLAGMSFMPRLIIDAQLELKDFTWPLLEALKKFEPFGQSNFKPRFLIKDLTVMSCENVGQGDQHLRLIVRQGNEQRRVICFGFGDYLEKLNPQDQVEMVCEAGINKWNGSQEIQLSLVDIKPAGNGKI